MNRIKQVIVVAVVATIAARSSAWQTKGEVSGLQQALEMARPGPQHERLGELAGNWDVLLRLGGDAATETTGTGYASTILDGRFLVLDFGLGEDQAGGSYRYTIGFDRRHDEYSIVVMDTNGTYFVTARGAAGEGGMRMAGVDDDPQMQSMGFEKKFLFELSIEDPDAFSVELSFIDTRTADEKSIPYAKYHFERAY